MPPPNWKEDAEGLRFLRAEHGVFIYVYPREHERFRWALFCGGIRIEHGHGQTLAEAEMRAIDAMEAFAREILTAIGRD